MEIGDYNIVYPSQTLKGLNLENIALKNRQNTFITITVVTAIIAIIIYVRYQQMKEELKKTEVRILNPEDIR